MNKRRLEKKEIKQEEMSEKKITILDSFKEMIDIFANPSKEVSQNYETNRIIKDSYIFIYLTGLIYMIQYFSSEYGLFGVIGGALFFLFYAFFLVILVTAISSFIWFSGILLDVKIEFEKQTKSIFMLSTISIILFLLIEMLANLIEPTISFLQILVAVYWIYGAMSIVKNQNNISWTRSFIIVGWPIIIFLILFLSLVISENLLMQSLTY